MARTKPQAETKGLNPVSFRFSASTLATLDKLSEEFGLTRTASIEAAIPYFAKALASHRPSEARKLADSAKKTKQVP